MAGVSPFSIHQELWHDCWVAATAAARAKKKQVDFSIEQRVSRLLADYGPASSMPLTLRVYGTMIKGFCVLNNERARVLHADCERVVYIFTQQPFGDEGKAMRLPPAKRKQAEALTLDINLAEIRESEAFDWTQGPLEEGVLLHHAPDVDILMAPPPDDGAFKLSDLPDEAFPALALPAKGWPDRTSKAAAEAEAAAEAVAAAAAAAPVAVEPAPAPAPEAEAGAALVPVPARVPAELLAAKRQQRAFRPFGPGRVFGFDEETLLPAQDADALEREVAQFTKPARKPAAQAELLVAGLCDHLGPLRVLLEPPPASGGGSGGGEGAGGPRAAPAPAPPAQWQDACDDGLRPLEPDLDHPPCPAPATPAATAAGAQALAVCPAEPPLRSALGADAELADIFGSQPAPSLPQKRGRERRSAAAVADPAAEVGAVLRRYLQAGASEARRMTLDDLLPPATTHKATAAQTFAAILALATSGELAVEQGAPYMPISISVA